MASISGKGIFFVNSRLTSPLLSEAAYLAWYDEDHIPEVVQTSGIKSAWRFKDVSPGASKPFLAMYPLQDIAFTQGAEFSAIHVHSDMLPGDGPIYDLAEMEVRTYNLVQVFDPTMKGEGRTKVVVAAQFEMGGEVTSEEMDRWYREEHLDRLAQTEGYLRTTRYKLATWRTNAQPRATEGEEAEGVATGPPTWLALHEYETEGVDLAELGRVTGSEWSTRVIQGASVAAFPVFGHVRTFGEGKWFHGEEV